MTSSYDSVAVTGCGMSTPALRSLSAPVSSICLDTHDQQHGQENEDGNITKDRLAVMNLKGAKA